jgi:uncharacterized membrane protein YdjX (TVP38/TMEM64 family)
VQPDLQRRRVLVLALLLVLVTALAASTAVHGWIERVLVVAVDVIGAHPRIGLAVFVLASILSAMLAFFSSAIVVPVAIGAWGEGTTVLLLWVSWLLGGCCSYAIGRTLGRRVVAWIIARDTLEYWTSRLSAQAGFFTVLTFQLALPSEVPGYVLGTLRYRFVIYLAALALAEVPFAFGAVYLGESFLERDYGLFVVIGLAGIAFSVIAWTLLHRRIGPAPTTARRSRTSDGRSSAAPRVGFDEPTCTHQ